MIEIDLIRHVKVAGKSALYGCTDVSPITIENTRLLERLLTQQKTDKAYQYIISSPLQRCQLLAKEFSGLSQLPLQLSPDLQEMNFGCFDGVAFDDIPYNIETCNETPFKDTSRQTSPCDESLYVQEKSVQEKSTEEKSTEQKNLNKIGQGSAVDEKKPKLHWSQLEAFFQAPAEIVLPQAETLSDFNHRVINAWKNLIDQYIAMATKQEKLPTPRRILVIAHGGVIRMILAHILQLDWQQASWHQKLHIGYASLSRVRVSQPYQQTKQQNSPLQQQENQQLHQQVTTIAMPLLEAF